MEQFPFTFYFGILSAIPSSWKHRVNSVLNPSGNEQRLVRATTLPKVTQYINKYLIGKKSQEPTAIQKWQEIDNKEYDWKNILSLPYLAVRDTKLHYFQFRFLHRIPGTNMFLFKINVKDSPLCTFCQRNNETLEHLFWDCDYVSNVWSESCNLCLKINFDLDYDHIKFGYLEEAKHPINFFNSPCKEFCLQL